VGENCVSLLGADTEQTDGSGQLQTWADQVAAPPMIKSRGWYGNGREKAVCFRHGGELSLKSLTFGPSFGDGPP